MNTYLPSSLQNLKKFLSGFESKKILVVGDVFVDDYFYGSVSRISPEAPVPVVNHIRSSYLLGGAGNVASNLVALGCEAHLLCTFANDKWGNKVRQLCDENNIVLHQNLCENSETIVKTRVISDNQQLVRLDVENKYPDSAYPKFEHTFKYIVNDFSLVIISDYNKGTILLPEAIIEEAHIYNIPVYVDPKGLSFEKYANADIIKPNLNEFLLASSSRFVNNANLAHSALIMKTKYNFNSIIITCGSNGVVALDSDNDPFTIIQKPLPVYDVTGAGDTFLSVVSVCLLNDLSLQDACYLANHACSLAVQKLGCARISLNEIITTLTLPSRLAPVRNLHSLVKELSYESQNCKVVFTNGCFDIIHAGHIDYLYKASLLGDILIVAVNSDASVSRLKGINRPKNSVDKRLLVLSALSFVDYLIVFDDDTPLSLIKCIKPNILVKGGDYSPDQIVGSTEVTDSGGQVITIPVSYDLSSSQFI